MEQNIDQKVHKGSFFFLGCRIGSGLF